MSASTYVVSDVMTHAVVSVGRGTTFKEIVNTMNERKVSALPVLEDEGASEGRGRVIGVVSEADLLAKEEYRSHLPSRFEQLERLNDLAKAGAVTADELMTAPAITVGPRATLAEAARIMARRRVKRLPVVDSQGWPKGIVSRADLLKVFLRSDEEIAEEVGHDVTSRVSLSRNGSVGVRVDQGVVTLTGSVSNTALVPLAARLVRSVEGVVDVRMELTGPAGAGAQKTATDARASRRDGPP